MGSDRKSKEKKKKSRKRSSSSDSEDERRSKKHRSDRKEKGKEKKSHKHRSDKEKKSRDKHHKGDRRSNCEFQELTNEDYFSKNNEFATWLKEEKKLFFSDLSSDSAREYFSDFVKAWNKQKLDSRYYEGISSGPRSAHSWKFK
ncbi:DYW deaminase domain-containing protein [Citrus sinensis]|uniref:Uncharacterized protein n=3 Tax=Citrus clementina TaxID=85681 RepID=V4S9F7_CITCL|nr:hypothetical protein CICLE_v10006169mg [Citrus x clementina]KAH9646304.1 DYW deaminase domain-containing protein [Citrus sinensis]GAY42442.1 hypothetical protein CUMW_066870 [Citrus unshiu]